MNGDKDLEFGGQHYQPILENDVDQEFSNERHHPVLEEDSDQDVSDEDFQSILEDEGDQEIGNEHHHPVLDDGLDRNLTNRDFQSSLDEEDQTLRTKDFEPLLENEGEQDTDNEHFHPELDHVQQIGNRVEKDDQFGVETATEIVEPGIRDREDNHVHPTKVYGWFAVVLSIISFLFIPILFAGAGIILGFVARNREAKVLGNVAITIGVVSIIMRLILMPFI